MIPKKLKILQLDSGGEKYLPYARSIAMSMQEGTFWQRKFGQDTVKVQVHSGVAQVWIEVPVTGGIWISSNFFAATFYYAQAENIYVDPYETLPFSSVVLAGPAFVPEARPIYIPDQNRLVGVYSTNFEDLEGLDDPASATLTQTDHSAGPDLLVVYYASRAMGNYPFWDMQSTTRLVYSSAIADGDWYFDLATYDLSSKTYSRIVTPYTIATDSLGGINYSIKYTGFITIETGDLNCAADYDATNTRGVLGAPLTSRDPANPGDVDYGLAYGIYHNDNLVSVKDVNLRTYDGLTSVVLNRSTIYTYSDGTNDYAAFFNGGKVGTVVPHYVSYAAGTWSAVTDVAHDFTGNSENTSAQVINQKFHRASKDRSVRVGALSTCANDAGAANRTRIYDVDVYNENFFVTRFNRTATESPQRYPLLDFTGPAGNCVWATLRHQQVDHATNMHRGIFLQLYWNENLLGTIDQSTPTMINDAFVDMKIERSGDTVTISILYKTATDTLKEYTGTVTIDTDALTMDSGSAPWGADAAQQPISPFTGGTFGDGGYTRHGWDG